MKALTPADAEEGRIMSMGMGGGEHRGQGEPIAAISHEPEREFDYVNMEASVSPSRHKGISDKADYRKANKEKIRIEQFMFHDFDKSAFTVVDQICSSLHNMEHHQGMISVGVLFNDDGNPAYGGMRNFYCHGTLTNPNVWSITKERVESAFKKAGWCDVEFIKETSPVFWFWTHDSYRIEMTASDDVAIKGDE